MMANTDHLGLFGCRSKSAARGKKFLSPKWTAGSRRIGSHPWPSQDLAPESGRGAR